MTSTSEEFSRPTGSPDMGSFKETRLLDKTRGFELWVLGDEWQDRFSEYIFRIYQATRGARSVDWEAVKAEMIADGRFYFPHAKVVAVLTEDKQILGSWGLIVKDISENEFQLPIEKKFGVDLPSLNKELGYNARYFFNGWRTAIDKGLLKERNIGASQSVFIFDLLLRGLTEDFDGNEHCYMGVAEMEELVLRYHRRIGVPWQKVGEAKTYWGNTKFPCAFKLQEFKRNLLVNYPDRYRFIYGG